MLILMIWLIGIPVNALGTWLFGVWYRTRYGGFHEWGSNDGRITTIGFEMTMTLGSFLWPFWLTTVLPTMGFIRWVGPAANRLNKRQEALADKFVARLVERRQLAVERKANRYRELSEPAGYRTLPTSGELK